MIVDIAKNQLLIPFGASRLTARAVEALGTTDGGYSVRCSVPHAVIRRDDLDALRLNDAPYDFTRRAAPREPSGETDPLSLLQTRIADLCGLWGKPARRWVSCYFEFISAQVELHRELLTRRLEGFGGLYNYRDWIYSALAPLPRAWIPISPGEAPTPATLLPADFAFWSGKSMVAVFLTGLGTPTAGHRERTRRLRASGTQVVEFSAESMKPGDPNSLSALLPACFERFWEGEPFPSGPFRASRFGNIELAETRE
jgi:hypothetical protein